jgi:hypothetical protein
MKNFRYISMVLMGLFFVAACSDDKENPVYDATAATAPTLSALNSAYTLTKDKAADAFATFSYSAANWGQQLATSYTLQASLADNFAKSYDLGTTTGLSMAVANKDINSLLINNNVTAGTAAPIYFRVLANTTGLSGTVTGIKTLASAVVTTSVTPYSTEVEYPKIYVIGDFNGWAHANDLFLYSFDSNTIYSGLIDFNTKAANGFKITGVADWVDNMNWGSDASTSTEAEASSLQLIASGGSGNISNYSKEFYNFTYDTSTLVLKKNFSFNTLSIVGDAGSEVSGWGTKEVDMTYSKEKQVFVAEVTFGNGEIKFRADHDWPLNWGGSDGVLKTGGDNIKVTAGKYLVTVNMNNPDNITFLLKSED